MSIEDTKLTVRQYLSLKGELDILSKRQDELKSRLKQAVEAAGQIDDRGHVLLTVTDEISGEVTLTQQRRVSKTLDINVAEKILTEKNLKEQCIVMVPTLDESEIMASLYKGLLTEEDIDLMFPAKISYAFLVKVSND